jgi:hypothetical protein
MIALLKRFLLRVGSPVKSLRKEVAGIGREDFPFLHRDYSPSSRVPCADFTGFIADRLQCGDVGSVRELMHEILKGNPGLGSDGAWIDAEINKIAAVNFQAYVHFGSQRAYSELAAMWVMAAKDGAGREFWISRDCKFPTFFAWALCPYDIVVKAETMKLVGRANSWLSRMGKEVPYWHDYPRFPKTVLSLEGRQVGDACARLLDLPVGSRLHLFTALSSVAGSLPSLTDYKLRSFGLDITESVQLILRSGLLMPSSEDDAVSDALTKGDLIRECEALSIPVRSSWNKGDLLKAITSVRPGFARDVAGSKTVVNVNPHFESELRSLERRCEGLQQLFSVLCFAG